MISKENLNFKIDNDIFNNKKKVKNILINHSIKSFFNLLTLVVIYIGRNLYINSLKGCNGNEFSCLINIQYIYDGINYCIFSSVLFLFVLFLVQLKISSSFHILILIFIIIEFIIRDHGNDFKNHGILNFYSLLGILFFGEIFIIIILFYIKLIKNKKINLFILSFILPLLLIYYNFGNKYFCKNWDLGINGTSIDNNKAIYSCIMNIPRNKCLIDILGPFMDFSIFVNCKKRKEKEKNILINFSNLKNLSKKIKKIGYPITIGNEEEIMSALYGKELYNYVLNNLINMDDKNYIRNLNDKYKPEIILDFTNNKYGELKIRLNYNKTLSERRKLLENNKTVNMMDLVQKGIIRNTMALNF